MNKNWSNTALVAYSLLPKIVHELNSAVISRVNSSFQSKHLKIGVSTEQLIGEILEITEEKRKIVNLRYITSSALDALLPKNKALLTARVIEKKTFQKIAEEQNCSLRTVFRNVAESEKAFESALNRAGYTEDWFEKEYGTDKYIAPIHKRLHDEKYNVAKRF